MALQARLPRWGMTRFTGVRVLQVRIHLPPAVSRQPNRVSLPRFHVRIGLHIVLFEACSAFTRVAACKLARSPYIVTAIRRLQTLRSNFSPSMTGMLMSDKITLSCGSMPVSRSLT